MQEQDLTDTEKQKVEELYTSMRYYASEAEIDSIYEQFTHILRLKREKNAVILGHNYMSPEVFALSDYQGDSLGLARRAAETNADIILFNGVHFMAETAKILNPEKKVLIADENAGCSLAESMKAEDVRQLRSQYPGRPIVSYINCGADVKAEVDVICTSANAYKIVEALDSDEVIVVPDGYLAANIARHSNKNIIAWQGKCMVHELFTEVDVELARKNFPGVSIIAHPECKEEVAAAADYSGSTSQMSGFIERSGTDRVMLLTECSMGDNLRSQHPDVEFISTCQTCPHMKKITLEKIQKALTLEKDEVFVDDDIRSGALQSLEKMFELSS